MAVTVAATALAAISPPAASADVSPNIIGGRDATENYSFVADVGGCGGVLIDPQWVLTAGHCVGGNAPGRTVRVGSIDRTTGGTVVTRAKEVKHPRNDQGLIKLASPVAHKPAPLGTSAQPGTPIRLLGWGRTKTPGPSPAPRILQEVDTTIVVSPENCGTDPARICTDNPDGWRGACSGDSGAPAITKTPDGWVVTGTTIGQRIVQPYRCANVPQIYSNVPFHANWIKSVIDAG